MARKFCSQCGAQLDEGARFCGRCGTPLTAHSLPQTEAHGPANTTPGHHNTPAPASSAPPFNYPKNETHSEIIKRSANGVSTVEFRNLHPNATWLFFFAFLGKTFILIPLFVITAFVEPLIAIIMSVSYLIILLLIARLLYRNYLFEITPYAFRKEHGAFHKRTVSIPFEQIQNINVRRSILDQLLGLAHVEIETAGDSGVIKRGTIGGLYSPAEGYIPGITPNEARDLKELLLSRMQNIR